MSRSSRASTKKSVNNFVIDFFESTDFPVIGMSPENKLKQLRDFEKDGVSYYNYTPTYRKDILRQILESHKFTKPFEDVIKQATKFMEEGEENPFHNESLRRVKPNIFSHRNMSEYKPKQNTPLRRSVVKKSKGGKKTRKNNTWIQFVKKVHNDEKKINKNFTYKKAMKKAASMK